MLAVRIVRGPAPYLPDAFVEANFDFYGRTLSGTPSCGPAGSAASPSSRARSARPSARVRRAALPARSKEMMDDLVANLIDGLPPPIEALDWMTEETKQQASTSSTVPPEDRLPRRSSATTPRST